MDGERPGFFGIAGSGWRVFVDSRWLTKHLARAEAQRFGPMLDGSPIGSPWEAADWDSDPDWDFNSAAKDTPEQLYALWDGTVARTRAKLQTVLAADGLDHSCTSYGLMVRELVCGAACAT